MDAYIVTISTLLDKLSAETGEDKDWLLSQVYDDLAGENSQAIETYIDTVVKKGKLGWNHPVFKTPMHDMQNQMVV